MIDELPFLVPDDAPVVETPRKHRHVWGPRTGEGRLHALAAAKNWDDGGAVCVMCGRERDEAKARMGRNNRKRGNAIQRQRIVGLGGRNLAGNNPNLDGLGLAFRYESKSGGSFPERLWRWLKGIGVEAGQTGVLIVTDTPGPGHRARSVVIVDYDDWRDLHGEATR